MSDDDLDEGQKKFIQAAEITTAEFLRLKEVYEKLCDARPPKTPHEQGHPEPNRKTLQMLAELRSADEPAESIQTDHPVNPEQAPERYLPTKHATQEILEIAKKEGDELNGQSLKLLDEVLYSGIAPVGNDDISHIKNAATVAKDLADLGKLFFDNYAKYLGTFGIAATLIKDIISWGEPKKKDPVLKEIDVLKGQLEALSDKIEVQFSSLKAFIVEQSFYANYTNKAKTLFDYLIRVLREASSDKKAAEGAQADFEQHYKAIDPEFFVTEILVLLENDATNLMKINMKNAELPTKDIFMKWKEVIESTLTEFLILEDFASGLLHSGDKRKANLIVEKIMRFRTLADKWENYYLSNRHYPDQALKFIRRIQNDVAYPKDEDKAEAIYNGLWGLFTRDNFYVVVMDRDIYYDYKVANKDQLIKSVDCGQFNVFVYCVATHSPEKAAKLRETLDKVPPFTFYEHSIFYKFDTMSKIWTSNQLKEVAEKMDGYGFCMTARSSSIATRWPKQFSDSKTGPGHFRYDIRVICMNIDVKNYYVYHLVTEP